MKLSSDFRIVVAILGIVVVFLSLLYAGDNIGIDSKVMYDLIAVLPGLSIIVVGCLILGTIQNEMFILPGFGVVGVGLAILIGEMNTTGMVIDTLITNGYSLIGMQGFLIVISIVVGALEMKKRR